MSLQSNSVKSDSLLVGAELVADLIPQWYSILPPFLAVFLAMITRKLLMSLGSAVILGGFLLAFQSSSESIIFDSASNSFGYLFNNITNTWNLKVLGFVICILSMISVIIVAGGLKGIVNHLLPFAKTPRSAQFITALTGLIVFIDDYANTMIVGSSMRPITDQYNISREKLAFIIDATSAPVAGLAVISTWIGFEVGLFGDVSRALNIGVDGYSMFFDAFAFRFYCILMLLFVFINIFMNRDFGPMLNAEVRAATTGKLSADDAKLTANASFSLSAPAEQSHISAKTALIPFAVLFFVLILGFWVDGNGIQQLQLSMTNLFSLGSWREVISSTKNSTSILLIAAAIGLLVSIITAATLARIKFNAIYSAIKIGTKSSFLPVLILLLAWSLKSACDDLNTGEYIVTLLGSHLSPLWFPAILFCIAAVTAFGTGTSWGTMSILIPISIPIAYALDGQTYGLVTIICLGAVLDGAIFGDHCSPISDTTIMSSIAA
ncbi:MAG: Na+/H+ antiporter NhaC family protein [Gammaproteobacteria bacterium]|nr:Na+/H+ antiporter NhaC family protein [Gammaproteobacteria bacterium]